MRLKVIIPLIIILLISVITPGLVSCGQESPDFSNEESNKRVAVATVHVAATGLGELLKNVSVEDRRLELIRNFVDPIRFFDDQSGYFFVYYYNCVSIANGGDPSLAGKDLSGYQDAKGKYSIRDLSAIAQNGGGFMDGYWPHPVTRTIERKIGYVEPIPGTDYFIGTGYYADTK